MKPLFSKKPTPAIPPLSTPAANPSVTLLSKLENLRAQKQRDIEELRESIRNLDEGISLLKWRPEAEEILQSLRRYV